MLIPKETNPPNCFSMLRTRSSTSLYILSLTQTKSELEQPEPVETQEKDLLAHIALEAERQDQEIRDLKAGLSFLYHRMRELGYNV